MKRTFNALTPLGDELKFQALSGREELGRLFEFRVSLLSKSHTIAANQLLGKPFTVEIECFGGAKRYLNGHCTRFAFTGKHTTARYYSYDAIVRPTLWYATRGSDMKVFQKKSVPDIIKEVLGKYPIDLDLSGLTASYRTWDYCTQYRETDFNFVSRLMEHEGIYYYFKHANGSHTLCLADAVSVHPACPVTSSIPFYAPDTTYSDESKDHFSQWLVTNAVDPGIFVTDEYDFKKPKADLSLNKNKTRGHGNASYEIYDFPGGYTELGDGEHYAQMRMDALQSGHELISGSGEVRNAALGHTFSLTNHKRGDQNREYLITALDYSAQDNDYESDGSGAYSFSVQVAALPTSETYRPKRLTPKPHTTGPESAVVVGPKGEEIYTDKYGRVKVQFHWDRIGGNDENSSCWIRVSHPWAGSNFGGIFTPRIGQEVLIDFINGDPDRPIVTHRLYNEDNLPPWDLPANKTQSGLLTRSTKGGDPGAGMKDGPGTANAIRFEDKRGAEQLWFHAEKDQLTEVENDEDKWVGNDRRKTVDRDETNHIKRDRTETVDRNEKITVHGWRTEEVDLDEMITIHQNRKERVDLDEKISIGKNRTEDVGDNETVKIGKNRTKKVGKNDKLTVGGNQVHLIKQNRMDTVALGAMENVGLAKIENIGAGYMLTVGAVMTTNVGIASYENIGTKKGVTAGTSVAVDAGEKITLSAGQSIVIEAGKHITLAAGKSSIEIDANGTINIRADTIQLDANKLVDVDGKIIDLN
jgi:type VI secretion system secreted protein VgrG